MSSRSPSKPSMPSNDGRAERHRGPVLHGSGDEIWLSTEEVGDSRFRRRRSRRGLRRAAAPDSPAWADTGVTGSVTSLLGKNSNSPPVEEAAQGPVECCCRMTDSATASVIVGNSAGQQNATANLWQTDASCAVAARSRSLGTPPRTIWIGAPGCA